MASHRKYLILKGDPDLTRHANISIFFPRTKPSLPECRVWGSSQFTYALRTWGEAPSLERSDRLNGQDRAPVCTYGMMRVPEVKRYIVTKRKRFQVGFFPHVVADRAATRGYIACGPEVPLRRPHLYGVGHGLVRGVHGLTSPLVSSLNAFSLSYADCPMLQTEPLFLVYI